MEKSLTLDQLRELKQSLIDQIYFIMDIEADITGLSEDGEVRIENQAKEEYKDLISAYEEEVSDGIDGIYDSMDEVFELALDRESCYIKGYIHGIRAVKAFKVDVNDSY